MIRKLLSFFFSLLILFLTLPFFYQRQSAYAVLSKCFLRHIDTSFTVDGVDPNPLPETSNPIVINIDPQEQVSEGKYTLFVTDDRNFLGGRLISFDMPKSDPDKNNGKQHVRVEDVTTGFENNSGALAFIEPEYYLDIYPANATRSDVFNGNSLCESEAVMPVTKSSAEGEGKCKIVLDLPSGQKYFTPDNGISFHVTDLEDPDNRDIRRGLLVKELQGNDDIQKSCVPNPDLKTNFKISTKLGDRLPVGDYGIYVTDSCNFFGDPQSPLLCTKTLTVCGTGKECLSAGDNCIPSKNSCPKSAPYCLKNDSNKYVCTVTATVENQCDKEGHKGECNTALGYFGFEPDKFATSVLRLFLAIGGGILLLFLILNGYRLMASQGDPEKTKEARESIVSAIAGLLLIIFSLVILQFITVDILGLPGFNK